MREVLMFSGGSDSFVAWWYLGKPKAIFCNLGAKYSAQEELVVHKLAQELDMDYEVFYGLDLGKWEREDAEIPMRNLFLAMVGAFYGDKIYLVVQRGEMEIPDRSEKFFEEASKFLSFLNRREIEVEGVFEDKTKGEIVKWYVEQGYPIDLLKKTYSCYTGRELGCGRCKACFRRWVAFEYAGVEIEFEHDIKKWSGIREYIERIKRGELDRKREEETILVLKKYRLL